MKGASTCHDLTINTHETGHDSSIRLSADDARGRHLRVVGLKSKKTSIKKPTLKPSSDYLKTA